MKITFKNLSLSIATVLLLTACGGGGGSSAPTSSGDTTQEDTSSEGTFSDSPVDGITYIINGISAKTINGGKYTYHTGDRVTFALGNLELGTITAKETVTPLDMFDDENISIYDKRVINMAKLLQSYDSDGDPENGITLSDDIQALDTSLDINWSSESNITNLSNAIDSTKVLRSDIDTINHLKANLPNSDDPLLKYQWYIKNDGVVMNSSGIAPVVGNDLNITPIWESYTGWNNGNPIKVQVVDVGVDMQNSDLKANIDFTNAYAFDTADNNATPTNISYDGEAHGTKVSGIIGAVGWNGIGIRGIAPNVSLVPFKLKTLQDDYGQQIIVNQEVLDKAWVTNPDANDIAISSNSWGSCFDQDTIFNTVLSSDTARALRDGKGRIYVVGTGNSRISGCRQAGETTTANTSRMKNNPYVITVAALNDKDQYSYYSQGGANVLVSAYGGGLYPYEPSIITTTPKQTNPFNALGDITNEYSDSFAGTSAATPMVSAGVALVLEACPTLTYQDVQYLIAKTAIKVDDYDKEMQVLVCNNSDNDCNLSDPNENIQFIPVYRNSRNELVFNNGGMATTKIDEADGEYGYHRVYDTNVSTMSYNGFILLPGKKSDFLARRTGYSPTARENIDSLLNSVDKSNMWFNNAAGLHFNENYGFGKLNVSGMINMCKNNYTLLGDEQNFDSGVIDINETSTEIDNGWYGLSKIINVDSNFKIRWVGLTVDANMPQSIYTEIDIISPSGTNVRLDRLGDSYGDLNETIKYGAYAFMDEEVNGDWNVSIKGYVDPLRTIQLEIKGY